MSVRRAVRVLERGNSIRFQNGVRICRATRLRVVKYPLKIMLCNNVWQNYIGRRADCSINLQTK